MLLQKQKPDCIKQSHDRPNKEIHLSNQSLMDLNTIPEGGTFSTAKLKHF
jgi:hypothetical protein